MPKITAGEVCRRFNVDKSKLSRALKKGEISGQRAETGNGWLIEVSEAQRWVDSLAQRSQQPEVRDTATPETTLENKVLQAELKALRELVEMLKADKEDWKRQAETNARLLENHAAKAEIKPAQGFFGFFRRSAA